MDMIYPKDDSQPSAYVSRCGLRIIETEAAIIHLNRHWQEELKVEWDEKVEQA